jgi:hypothetical protein
MSFETYTEEYITYIFLWHSMGDACLQCLSLNGNEWREQDLFQDILYDMFWGDIYDLNLGLPLTHGGSGTNCRCTLEVRAEVNLREIDEFKEINSFLEVMRL